MKEPHKDAPEMPESIPSVGTESEGSLTLQFPNALERIGNLSETKWRGF